MLFFVALVYTKNTLYKLLSSVILVFKLINAYSHFKVSKTANQIADRALAKLDKATARLLWLGDRILVMHII